MFLKALYFYNKAMFVIAMLCLGVFIFLNVKWGWVATPFQQFGMYSGQYHLKDTQVVFTILNAHGNMIDDDFPVSAIDFIQAYPYPYETMDKKNQEVYNNFSAFRFLGFANASHFQNKVSKEEINEWFFKRIFQKLGKPPAPATIYENKIGWGNGGMILYSSPQKIADFAP